MNARDLLSFKYTNLKLGTKKLRSGEVHCSSVTDAST